MIFHSYVSLPEGSGHEATKHLDFFPFTSGNLWKQQHVEVGDSMELPATDLNMKSGQEPLWKMVDWFYVCWFHPILYIHMIDAPVFL